MGLSRINAAGPARLGDVVGEVRALAQVVSAINPALVAATAPPPPPGSAYTARAFLSDIRLMGAWCRRSRVRAGEPTPAIAAYIHALSGQDHDSAAARATETRAPAAIARYLVSIGWAYRMAGRDDPTASPLVRLEHKAARKVLGTKQRQARAIRFKGRGPSSTRRRAGCL
jgi:hypothetical protein